MVSTTIEGVENMGNVKSSSLGYPRIGEKREWKKNLEQLWAGEQTEEAFLAKQKQLRLSYLQTQVEAGLDYVPVGDFSDYDHVLDTAVSFGLVPDRFAYNGGKVSVSTYFEIARGAKNAVAAEMTKWFNTNYHYIVPELNAREPQLVHNRWLELFEEAKSELGVTGKPVILGPITFVKLAKQYGKKTLAEHVQKLLPLYGKVFDQLTDAGATLIQVDEPVLTGDVTEADWLLFEEVYRYFEENHASANLLLQTYFEAVTDFSRFLNLPTAGAGIDCVAANQKGIEQLQKIAIPENKIIALGILDGRNIWRSDLVQLFKTVNNVQSTLNEENGQTLILQPSCSLLHVPVSLKHETKIFPELKDALAFANEKLVELDQLKEVINGNVNEAVLKESIQAVEGLNQSSSRNNEGVQALLHERKQEDSKRSVNAQARFDLQKEKLKLPLLPTTTIGSFPQTKEVRKQRLLWRKGELSNEAYSQYINAEIERWIQIQEKIGLDVLVHGEFERTDMVEFFGEKLAGFQFSTNGWVQSYGSRCVKPPIIYGDVAFQEEMTVKETVFAQSKTEKPVKGMLTGPVTIYNWSFPRTDLAEEDVVNQIALALEKEVLALEKAGIGVIQVDEPALREGLPLKKDDWKAYLDQSVKAFQLSVKSVQAETQIHTHMCYSDFQDIIESIDALDADVISIEMSRSHGELISSFEHYTYDKGIGLGVYDIHSPRVPSEEEMIQNIQRALKVLDQKRFWVNPDCGLKTRQEPETIAALKAMVRATNQVRETI
ncbi:5-methyltetrahydropteroyltriglutamate-homocysteine methyltransferase [Bacillus sp. JCM 19046]|nr:5-methyltetrahydropteroyltriglutamate-homocysteine methyltransferase [Bacillus sp. JCM 19045]GAF19157.1 5-methyltetrahydropteroyltriglutamate-homocysteine methyltransferase [Bacillus sp. JCM 19046]